MSMTDAEFCTAVENLVRDCREYQRQLSKDRIRSQEYYDGVMKDVPFDEGRSKVVSRDVRAAIKKVVPSVTRIILGNDKVVEYQPVGQGDEETCDQATDFINFVVFPEADGYEVIKDAIHDAMLLRNGIIKWWCEQKKQVQVSEHTGLDDMAFQQLVVSDDVEVLEHTERQEQIDTPQGSMPVNAHDVKIKRVTTAKKLRLAAVPLEDFLIHSEALCIEDSPIVGELMRVRKTDLIAMGYDREMIEALSTASDETTESEAEEITRRDVFQAQDDQVPVALQEVDYYELLVRVDFDNDGIAELRRVCFAGGLKPQNLLANDDWDEVNYADIVCERRSHQWEGNSVADDVTEIQKIKTVLLRQTLDNLYWQNNLQDIVQEGAIVNPEAVTNPQFGLPIRVSAGVDVRAVIGSRVVPFVAKESFAMLEYLDNEVTDRTGISDASSGMAPDALQNMTAKASAMIEQAGVGQTELMVRTIAHGLTRVFKGLLKLVIQHQDKPRMVRLRDKWTEFDPRTWNADMDATVNTGLGAGTRERDMMMMQVILTLQEKLLAALGPDNPYITPDNLYNAIAKQVEAAGLRSVDLYFTKPDEQKVQAMLEARKNQPSEEQQKAQAQIQIEQAKGQIELQIADKKMQTDASKEAAQRDADLTIKQAELEKETQARMHEAQLNAQQDAAKLDIEREKIASNERIAAAKLQAEITLEREKMDREDARAEKQREAEIQKAHAASIGKQFERNDRPAAQ